MEWLALECKPKSYLCGWKTSYCRPWQSNPRSLVHHPRPLRHWVNLNSKIISLLRWFSFFVSHINAYSTPYWTIDSNSFWTQVHPLSEFAVEREGWEETLETQHINRIPNANWMKTWWPKMQNDFHPRRYREKPTPPNDHESKGWLPLPRHAV